jgi:hypothetical protein
MRKNSFLAPVVPFGRLDSQVLDRPYSRRTARSPGRAQLMSFNFTNKLIHAVASNNLHLDIRPAKAQGAAP